MLASACPRTIAQKIHPSPATSRPLRSEYLVPITTSEVSFERERIPGSVPLDLDRGGRGTLTTPSVLAALCPSCWFHSPDAPESGSHVHGAVYGDADLAGAWLGYGHIGDLDRVGPVRDADDAARYDASLRTEQRAMERAARTGRRRVVFYSVSSDCLPERERRWAETRSRVAHRREQ